MEIEKMLLWIVLPYMVAAILAMGMIWRYDAAGSSKTTSFTQKILSRSIICLLGLCTATGLGMIHFSEDFSRLLDWLISLLQFRPDMNLIEGATLLSQFHVIILMVFVLALAFTNNMGYILKPHLLIKYTGGKWTSHRKHL